VLDFIGIFLLFYYVGIYLSYVTVERTNSEDNKPTGLDRYREDDYYKDERDRLTTGQRKQNREVREMETRRRGRPTGYKMSEESRKKTALSMTGSVKSDETKDKISESMKIFVARKKYEQTIRNIHSYYEAKRGGVNV
jgi:hypothetical protein